MPQGSVLGPLLFNICINDLLLFLDNTDICNYADDTTLFACDIDTDNVVAGLELDSAHAIKWFFVFERIWPRNTCSPDRA